MKKNIMKILFATAITTLAFGAFTACETETPSTETPNTNVPNTETPIADETAPEIALEKVKTGIVGMRYVLPNISVIDNSGALIEPTTKLYKLNGETKGDEVEVKQGVFTPDASGFYLLETTATDGSGNTATKTAKIYIREPAKEHEVLSFDDETDIERVGLLGATLSYLDTYENENGVVKFSYTGGYWANRFAFLPLCDLSEDTGIYEKYDSFVVKMYIVKTDEVQSYFTNLAIKDYETNSYYYSPTSVKYNEWVEYEFPIEYLKLFASDTLDLALGTKIFGYGNDSLKDSNTVSKGEFYLSDIYMSRDLTVDVAGDTLVGMTVQITTQDTETQTVITVKSPSGVITTVTDGNYTISEAGKHTVYVHGAGYYGTTEFKGVLATLNNPPKSVTWKGYNLTTYGASVIDSNDGVTLIDGTYSGADPRAMGTANVPYIAFNGNYSAGKTVVVDFTGGNLPNIAFFANTADANTSNFVGAKGLMFCQTVLTKEGEVYSNTSYADQLNVYGPTLFTKYSDTSKTQDIYQNLFYPYSDATYRLSSDQKVFIDYETMQADTTTQYRLLVRFNTGTKISCSAVLMVKNATGAENEYKVVYKGERTIAQTYETHGLTDGSVIIYGRPYAETKIDKLHTIYDSANDGALVYGWTGTAFWGYEPPASTASADVFSQSETTQNGALSGEQALPVKREEY